MMSDDEYSDDFEPDLQLEVDQLRLEIAKLKTSLAGDGAQRSNRSIVEIPFEELELEDKIGGGGIGVVDRGKWHGTEVAIKRCFIGPGGEETAREFEDEAFLLGSLRHPNIIQYLGASLKRPNLCLVSELCPMSLHDALYLNHAEVGRKEALRVAIDIASAMAYLHAQKPMIIHRDLKPRNVLLTGEGNYMHAKLCDFGLAITKKHSAGTPAYMAPELLEERPFSEKVDVYAFGILLNELFSRQPPFEGLDILDLKRAVLSGKRPAFGKTIPIAARKLVEECWTGDASTRPSFATLLPKLRAVKLF
eukprot:TRINITY_DN4929_c0_g1::TRINITY_DN4929_c0_g1_i1::g.16628::m.16628 TRINITY_DN4929_c0_g1::TRINITY_DN4929_c0_g1_i1::g.16628  ORF type:complete len:306 (-),score=58.89,sp/Q9C9U5/SIS8_ARATH/37.92/2e-51,Pkinase/PF00069.20/1.1e-49,Pkinase_Tyr/PF07714.12/4e-48,APH/PF01636.18/0.0024 TRINITY_DN4929_c0_g1_i1:180-1097(-)